MEFISLPARYTTIDSDIAFTLQLDEPGDIDIRIRNLTTQQILGGKRFINVSKASFNSAPRLRSLLSFSPSTGSTGFKLPDDRTIMIQLEVLRPGSDTVELLSPTRYYIPGDPGRLMDQFMTTMPHERLIPAGTADELTLYINGKTASITVTATNRDTTITETYSSARRDFQIFRLDTRDFPGCDSITVNAGICGTIVYTVVPSLQETVRLAWRTHAGSIEHYSFPKILSTTLLADKRRSEGSDGHLVTAAETSRQTTLLSAFERPEVLEALAELISARAVWIADAESYTPVDILSDQVVVQRYGSLSALELTFRPQKPTIWN